MDIDMDLVEPSDPIDSLNTLEATYYNAGYTSGFNHGTLHGLFEGRALGQEKCWELWEELGFMEGVGKFWQAVGIKQATQGKSGVKAKGKKVTARAMSHIETLLNLISTFPTINPSSELPASPSPNSPDTNSSKPNEEPDLALLLSHIRARYRLLCSSLAIRPRLVAAEDVVETGIEGGEVVAEGAKMGVEGPMKGVDQRLLRF